MQGDDQDREQGSAENRTPAMTGGADPAEKTKPSPSGEEAMPGGQPATPTPPG